VFFFPYNWYFMYHKRCFVYLCYDFPIIDILCFTRLLCISVLWFPYNWHFMYLKYCFVCRCSSFSIIGILCITSVVLYICVLLSLLLVFYVSQALFCISVFCFPYYWYFMFHKRCFVYLCSAFPIIGILCFTSVVLYICVLISL
jgi:hypothetical protein